MFARGVDWVVVLCAIEMDGVRLIDLGCGAVDWCVCDWFGMRVVCVCVCVIGMSGVCVRLGWLECAG